MENSYTISVKQKHIDAGIRTNCHCCPIAKAIQEQLGTNDVSVTSFDASVNGLRYRIPDEATDFISTFDVGFPVEPFEFTLTKEDKIT